MPDVLRRVTTRAANLRRGDVLSVGRVERVSSPYRERGTGRRVVDVTRWRRPRKGRDPETVTVVVGASTTVRAMRTEWIDPRDYPRDEIDAERDREAGESLARERAGAQREHPLAAELDADAPPRSAA